MVQAITDQQLNLYQSLFRGRTDVYAKYWEKNGQANYSPVYDVNWTAYNNFKLTGGLFRAFKDKKLIPLTPDIIKKHLIGSHAIGVYPILQDNTSYFIAADFDGNSWQQDFKNFIDEFKEHMDCADACPVNVIHIIDKEIDSSGKVVNEKKLK